MVGQHFIPHTWQVTSHRSRADELKTCQTLLVTGCSLVRNRSQNIGYPKLIHPQIRSTWVPADSFCSVPYVRTNNKTIVCMFVTDFILLVTMLVGLFRLRRLGAGRSGVGHLLWKQVSSWRTSLASSSPSANVLPTERASFGYYLQPRPSFHQW
jgi:hypothetical protein